MGIPTVIKHCLRQLRTSLAASLAWNIRYHEVLFEAPIHITRRTYRMRKKRSTRFKAIKHTRSKKFIALRQQGQTAWHMSFSAWPRDLRSSQKPGFHRFSPHEDNIAIGYHAASCKRFNSCSVFFSAFSRASAFDVDFFLKLVFLVVVWEVTQRRLCCERPAWSYQV